MITCSAVALPKHASFWPIPAARLPRSPSPPGLPRVSTLAKSSESTRAPRPALTVHRPPKPASSKKKSPPVARRRFLVIGRVKRDLLDLDLGTSRFDLLLDLFGFGLGDAFLEGLRSAFDEGLRFG